MALTPLVNIGDMQMENKNLLTISELASALNLKPSKIRRMIFERKIPFLKLGRLIRFNFEDINLWLQEQKRESGENGGATRNLKSGVRYE